MTGNRPSDATVAELAHGVYTFLQPDGGWWINNAGFVVSEATTLVIDTCATELRSTRLRDEVDAKRSPTSRTVLLNTHHHGDHTYGNHLFGDATVVAAKGCRRLVERSAMARYEELFEQPDWGHLELRAPGVEFEGSMDIWVGDRLVEVHACPEPAHTGADAVAWLPEEGILFAGDLVFNGGTPFIAFGSVEGSIRSLEWLRRFRPDVVVPGHGAVCDTSVLDSIASYLHFVAEVAERALGAGQSPLEAAQSVPLGAFGTLTEAERIVGNLHRAMAEQSGSEFDAGRMVLDTLAYVGHRIDCHA